MPSIHIRPAKPADTALILTLIKELAEFEKLAHQVVATEDTLRETLFGPKALTEVRSKSIGLKLLQAIAKIAVERGCGRFEWSVLDWNERAISFYHRLGAKPQNEWTVQRLTEPEIRALAEREEIS
jgi:hypothetical protein